MTELKSWGQEFSNDFPHSPDHECPNSHNCGSKIWGSQLFPYMIGFKSGKFLQAGGLTRIGIGIIECPKCFTKFYFHLFKDSVRHLKKFCPNWPE